MDKILDIKLAEALKKNEVTELSELEKICIPKIKSGRDLLCIAGEGSGKTTAIVLSVLQRLKNSLNDTPRAVIIVPDTDCAIEMKNEFLRFGSYTDLRVHLACENEKIDTQKDRIYMGSDVVIGTTKRLNQIYSLYALDLSGIKLFVIDDAEEVLKNMNYSQVIRLANGPAKSQFILFANRMTDLIERFSEEAMVIHEIVEINDEPSDEE